MGNAAIDYSDQLDAARMNNDQMPKAGVSHPGDLHVPQSGHSDSYNNLPTNGAADNYNDQARPHDDSEEGRSSALGDAREKGTLGKAKDAINTAKNIAETATPMGAVSLIKQIDFIGDMPYVAAMGAALVKDGLDLVDAETVVLPIIFGALCSIFIFMMMLVVGSRGKSKTANALLKKVGLLIGGGIADAIPGIDFFPVETLTVAVIYYLTLVERKNAQQ